jgi:uncharacterized membrane protein YdbT with pleckstrin-like domain
MVIDSYTRIAFLKKIHLFFGLDDGELAALAEDLTEYSYPEGATIFAQGSKADSFYLIYKGSVKIVHRSNGRDETLGILVEGDYMGDIALLQNRNRYGTGIAMTDTLLLVMSRDKFGDLLKRAPQLRSNFELAVRSRELANSLHFKWLEPDEVIYFLARKHPIVFYKKLILPMICALIPLGFLWAWLTYTPLILVAFAGIASAIWIILWVIWLVIDWRNDYYIITNHRVVSLEKVVALYSSRQESPLNTIQSVDVETGPLGRILDYGDLIVRTFIGKMLFDNVSHPFHAQRMIQEYWHRTQEQAAGQAKEEMKNAIRRNLGIPVQDKPKTETRAPANSFKPRRNIRLLSTLGANTLRLRYEEGASVVYRKHWYILFRQAWIQILALGTIAFVFLYRQYQLAISTDQEFVSFEGGVSIDAWSGAFIIIFFVLVVWLVYDVVDWANDRYEVTSEQIIDLYKKPFGTESRNAAQLENILGTEFKRVGIIANLLNFGNVLINVGGTVFTFEGVRDPASVQLDIDSRRAARVQKKAAAEVAAERERMADWLATYHKSAAQFLEEERKNQKPG